MGRSGKKKADNNAPGKQVPAFLIGGGEMGALTRAFDWTRTPLRAPETWPQSLKVAVRLLLTSQHPMFIWWGPELIQFYNDAYRQTMGPERHPSALGQPGRECWEEIWDIIGPQIEFVMSGKGATWHEDQLVPVTRHGSRQDVWWTYGFSPIDEGGEVGGVLVVCQDVTRQHRLTEELRRANLRLTGESSRLREMFHQAPGFMCMLRGPDHVFELVNASYLKLVGDRDLIGKPARAALPEVEGQGFFELLDQVYTTGESYVGRRLPIRFRTEPDGPVEQRYLDFVYQPIADGDGPVSGIFVEGVDVTDHVQAEERQQLLIRELHHRVKNTLATVQAVLGSTARTASSVEELHQAFSGRLLSLSKTHSALIEKDRQSVSVRELLRLELEPYDDADKSRIRLEGPDTELVGNSAVMIGMAFHELATNAAKYGSLSEIGGYLSIKWSIVSGSGERSLCIVWSEHDGPPVRVPEREGFGSRLLMRVLKAQAGADVEMDYACDGLRANITVPLDQFDLAGSGG
ncbi:MAG: sensor histidine kinase [Rhodomicrobiaceae bacterium]